MLLARLTDNDISSCTGSGTGMFGSNLKKKTSILEKVLEKHKDAKNPLAALAAFCLLYTSPSPRDGLLSRMPSSA